MSQNKNYIFERWIFENYKLQIILDKYFYKFTNDHFQKLVNGKIRLEIKKWDRTI